MQVTPLDRMRILYPFHAPGNRLNNAVGTHPSADTVKQRCSPPVLTLHKGLLLLLLLLLLLTGQSAYGEYTFDENEIAGTADASLPLSRPFDSTACSLYHLAQQQRLLLALQQLEPSASRGLLQDASAEALLKATQSGIIVEEAERSIKFGRQAEVTVKLKFTNRGASPVSALFILLPYYEVTQLGWITAFTQAGKCLAVRSVAPPLPSISSLRWEDWGLKHLILEQIEKHLKKASEGQGRPYRPLPRSLDLESIQSVIFATSSNWPLPYKTLRSSLSLQLPAQTTLGDAGEKHMRNISFRKLPGEVWKWESADTIAPLKAIGPFAVILPLPQHLGYALTMERLLVAPLSGSAVCKDLYKIHNDAALQEGPFNPVSIALLQGLPPGISRLAAMGKDVPRSQRVPTHVLFDLHAKLPPDVFNLDVGDSAGNLTSTFASREGPKEAPLSTHLEVWPRFPVLGGWNFDLQVSYDVPVSSIMPQHGVKGSTISLNIPLEPPFQDLYVEHLSLTVALPTGAKNIQYSSLVEFESVEEITVKWWFDIVTSRPALRLKWHSASPTPAQHEGRSLTVTFDYPYSIDLEYLKKAFALLLLVFIIALATVLHRWKLRFSTMEEEAAIAALHETFEAVKKELWRKTDAAIYEGRMYMDSIAATNGGNLQTSLKQRKTQEQEERWQESMRQHEEDITALLETVPEASSLLIAFLKALERHREAVRAFTRAVPDDCKEAEEANHEVEASAENLRALARGWEGSTLKQHEA